MNINICTYCRNRHNDLSIFLTSYFEMIKNAPSFMNFSLHVLEYGGEHFDFSQFADKLNFRTTRIESDRYVHPSARNLSVKRSIDENPAAEILMISDCDLIFKVNFWKNFIDISAHFNIRHGAADLGHGSVIISKSNFLKLRGYNELMSHGWGWDDCDLYERARNIGISEIAGWYENTCEEIKQDDYQRQVEFKTNLTLEQSNNMNKSIKEFNSIFK